MAEDHVPVEEYNRQIAEWGEYYSLDDTEISAEQIGAQPAREAEIARMEEGDAKDAAIAQLAEENVRWRAREQGLVAASDVLEANGIEIQIEQVEEIEPDALPVKPEDDIPFEVRGRPTGAAVITPAGREIIYLAYGADAGTGHHEAYHTLRRRLTDRDRAILAKHFANEEAEARGFVEYMTTNKAPTTMIRSVWRKLKALLSKIRDALIGRGFRTPAEIFGEIETGKVAKRTTDLFGQPLGAKIGGKQAEFGFEPGRARAPTAAYKPELATAVAQALNKDKAATVEALTVDLTPRTDLFNNPANAKAEVQAAYDEATKGKVMFEDKWARMRRDLERKAQINAAKARLKEKLAKKPKGRRTKTLPFKPVDTTPPIQVEWLKAEEADLPQAKLIYFYPPEDRRTQAVPNQPVPEEVYDRNRQRSAIAEKARDIGQVVKRQADEIDQWLSSVSYRLEKVSPEVFRRVREHGRRWNMRHQQWLERVKALVRAEKKMKRTDRADLDLALKMGDVAKRTEIIEKYNLQDEYAEYRAVDDEMRELYNQVGGEIPYRSEHWHRRVKDPERLLEILVRRVGRSNILPPYEAALARRREQAGGRELTRDERAQVLNSLIRGFGKRIWIARPAAAKERSLWSIDAEINKCYYRAVDSMIMNIGDMARKIADGEFFGKKSKRIQKLRAERARLATRLYKASKRIGYGKPIPEESHDQHISQARERFEQVNRQLEELDRMGLADTIGDYLADLVINKEIDFADEQRIQKSLEDYFGYRPTGRAAQAAKSVAYITVLGSFFNTLTQLKDYGRIIYRSPARALTQTMKMLIPGVKLDWTMADIWMKDIATDITGMSRILDAQLSANQFKRVDRKEKELWVNVVMDKYGAQARRKRPTATFRERIERHMGKDADATIRDLKSGRKTELLERLAWGELLDMHPVALSEMTQAYLRGRGGTRFLYTLRTFGLKELEYCRREIFQGMAKHPTRNLARLVWLAFSLAMAYAGVETLKDLIRGRKPKFQDEVIDSWLQLLFMSRFNLAQIKKKGVGRGVGEAILPPTRAIDAPVMDAFRGELRETPRNIPIVGEPFYWWFGHGREKTERQEGKGKSVFE